VEFFVQQISAETLRPLKTSSLDFSERIPVMREQFEMLQRGIATGAIIEVHANEPPILYFARFASDTALALRCPNYPDAQAGFASSG